MHDNFGKRAHDGTVSDNLRDTRQIENKRRKLASRGNKMEQMVSNMIVPPPTANSVSPWSPQHPHHCAMVMPPRHTKNLEASGFGSHSLQSERLQILPQISPRLPQIQGVRVVTEDQRDLQGPGFGRQQEQDLRSPGHFTNRAGADLLEAHQCTSIANLRYRDRNTLVVSPPPLSRAPTQCAVTDFRDANSSPTRHHSGILYSGDLEPDMVNLNRLIDGQYAVPVLSSRSVPISSSGLASQRPALSASAHVNEAQTSQHEMLPFDYVPDFDAPCTDDDIAYRKMLERPVDHDSYFDFDLAYALYIKPYELYTEEESDYIKALDGSIDHSLVSNCDIVRTFDQEIEDCLVDMLNDSNYPAQAEKNCERTGDQVDVQRRSTDTDMGVQTAAHQQCQRIHPDRISDLNSTISKQKEEKKESSGINEQEKVKDVEDGRIEDSRVERLKSAWVDDPQHLPKMKTKGSCKAQSEPALELPSDIATPVNTGSKNGQVSPSSRSKQKAERECRTRPTTESTEAHKRPRKTAHPLDGDKPGRTNRNQKGSLPSVEISELESITSLLKKRDQLVQIKWDWTEKEDTSKGASKKTATSKINQCVRLLDELHDRLIALGGEEYTIG
jgi:hypothetical protein